MNEVAVNEEAKLEVVENEKSLENLEVHVDENEDEKYVELDEVEFEVMLLEMLPEPIDKADAMKVSVKAKFHRSEEAHTSATGIGSRSKGRELVDYCGRRSGRHACYWLTDCCRRVN